MDKRTLFVLIVVLLVAAGLRFYRISHHSLWDDEIATADTVQLPVPKLLNVLATQDATPPLFYLIAHGWVKLGYSEAWLRTLSVLFSVAAVALTFLLARMLFGFRAAVFSGAVSALWPLGIYIAQEFRAYAVLLFFSALTFYSLAALLRGKRWALWVFPLSVALGVVTHYYFIFIFAVVACYLVLWWFKTWNAVRSGIGNFLVRAYDISRTFGVRGKSLALQGVAELQSRLKPWWRVSWGFLSAVAFSAAVFLLWLKYFFVQLAMAQSWRPYVGSREIIIDVLLGLTVSSLPLLDVMRVFWFSWPFVLALFGWTVFLVAGLFVMRARLLVVGSLFGFLIVLLVACRGIPMFDLRAASAIFPLFALWTGAGFDLLWRKAGLRVVAVISLALVLAGSVLSLHHYYFDPRFERQNWREAAELVRSEVGRGAVAVSYLRFKALGLEYYLCDELSYLIEDTESFFRLTDRDEFLVKRSDELAENCRVVLLDYHGVFFDPKDVLRSRLRQDHTLTAVRSWESYDPRTNFAVWIYDCSKRIEDVELSSFIDFSELESEPQILGGFTRPLANGRFMGERGRLALSASDLAKGCLELEFYAPYEFFDGGPFEVWVEQDGVERGSVRVDESGMYRLCAPIEVVPHQPVLIDIISERTFVPAEVIRTDELSPRSINVVSASVVQCP